MTTIPAQYAWLQKSLTDNSGHPEMVNEALKFYGVHEGDGVHNNPVIMSWVTEISQLPGKSSVAIFKNDHTMAWCGLFAAHLAHACGEEFPDGPLWALNWAKFGTASPTPSLGDVLVFHRPGGGHVGLYVGEDASAYHVLGGNEGDQVSIVREPRARLYAARRPIYVNGLPANVKPYKLSPVGTLSTNEA